MKDGDLGLPERQSPYGKPRLLQTDDELIQWRFWNSRLDPTAIGQYQADKLERIFRYELLHKNYIGGGLLRTSSAVFALFDKNQIISAGSVEITEAEHWDTHAPVGSKYARIDNGETRSKYRSIGLNTQITQARIEWARQNGLPCVETKIDPSNYASIKAKLKAGFVIDSVAWDVDVLYPIADEVMQYRGLHGGFSEDADNILITGLSHLRHRLRSHFGVLGEQSIDDPRLFFIRMIPRDFGGFREI